MSGIAGEADDLVALADFRKQVLGFAVEVVANHRVGSIQNILSRAIVLLEKNHLRANKIPLKLGDVANVRTAEGINRLVRVTHHGQ